MSVRRQVADQRRCIFFPVRSSGFLLFEHLPGRLRAAFSFRYVILGSHDVSGEAHEATVRFRP